VVDFRGAKARQRGATAFRRRRRRRLGAGARKAASTSLRRRAFSHADSHRSRQPAWVTHQSRRQRRPIATIHRFEPPSPCLGGYPLCGSHATSVRSSRAATPPYGGCSSRADAPSRRGPPPFNSEAGPRARARLAGHSRLPARVSARNDPARCAISRRCLRGRRSLSS
jgi:hypothetical protein